MMMKIRFPTSQDIYIEVNGKKLAVVESYKAKSIQDSKYIEALGEKEPVGVVTGKINHLIELSRVYSYCDINGDSINFYDLQNFNLVVVKPDRRIVYSNCEWIGINESASVNDAILENVQIISAKRMEIIQ